MIDVTQLPCPDAPGGETHHLIPRKAGAAQEMVCRYCRKTQRALREEAESR